MVNHPLHGKLFGDMGSAQAAAREAVQESDGRLYVAYIQDIQAPTIRDIPTIQAPQPPVIPTIQAPAIHTRPMDVTPQNVSLAGHEVRSFPEPDTLSTWPSVQHGSPTRLSPSDLSPVVIWWRTGSGPWSPIRGMASMEDAHTWLNASDLPPLCGEYIVKLAGEAPPARSSEGYRVQPPEVRKGHLSDSRAASPPYEPGRGRQVVDRVAPPPSRVGATAPGVQSGVHVVTHG
jgi:hypothetical protein